MEASLGQDTTILVVIAVIAVLIVLLVGVIMLWAAVALMSRNKESAPDASEDLDLDLDDELDLPSPERPVEAPPQPLDRGMGAYFDSSWDEDEEAATEVAAMPPTAPAPTPPGGGPSPLAPLNAIQLEDADEQATEVLSATENAELAAAVRAARERDGDAEIPSFGDQGGAFFDDEWDEDEAPTAVMTGDMADRYADMLLDDDDDDDGPGPGRVVAKKS